MIKLPSFQRAYWAERISATIKNALGHFYYSQSLQRDNLTTDDILEYVERSHAQGGHPFAELDQVRAVILMLQTNRITDLSSYHDTSELPDTDRLSKTEAVEDDLIKSTPSTKQKMLLEKLNALNKESEIQFSYKLLPMLYWINSHLQSLNEAREAHDGLEKPLRDRIKQLEAQKNKTSNFLEQAGYSRQLISLARKEDEKRIKALKQQIDEMDKRRLEIMPDRRNLRQNGSQTNKGNPLFNAVLLEIRELILEHMHCTKYVAYSSIVKLLSIMGVTDSKGKPFSRHQITNLVESHQQRS